MNCVLKNEEFCIKNEELCIYNEELCIENDEFCSVFSAKRGSPVKGGGARGEEEDAERQKALQDKVTEGILGAGIL